MNKEQQKNLNLLSELTRRRIVSQYRNSFLGMLWTVLNPLLNMLIMWVVFSQVLQIDDPLYPLYLLSGNILFQALRTSTDGALGSIVGNRGLIIKTKIKISLFPLSVCLSSIINLLFSMISLILIMLGLQIFGGYSLFNYQIIFFVLEIPAFILFTYGIGLFLSALFVYFRDIKYLYSVFLTLWLYLTPIFYKIERIGENSLAGKVIRLNPMYYFLKYFRDSIYNLSSIGSTYPPSFKILLLLYLVGLFAFLFGFIVFRKLKKNFISYI